MGSKFARTVTSTLAAHNATRLSRSALAMTLTDDSDIAAAATIGDSSSPNAG